MKLSRIALIGLAAGSLAFAGCSTTGSGDAAGGAAAVVQQADQQQMLVALQLQQEHVVQVIAAQCA